MTQTCPLCTRAISADTFACSTCADAAKANLRAVADFASWADDKRARLGSVWSVGQGSRAAEQPLPYDPRVTRVLQPIHNDLTGWARIVWDEIPSAQDQPASTDTAGVARWLSTSCAKIARLPFADEAFAAFEKARESLERLFDRPPDKVYLGRCKADTDYGECTESLYVEAGALPASVTCPRCSAVIAVSDRQAELAQDVEDYNGTARELSRLLRMVLGEDASPRMIWAYEKHGLIQQRGTRVEFDTMGRRREVPMYRIGEVREAAKIMAQDEEKRRTVRRTMRGAVA